MSETTGASAPDQLTDAELEQKYVRYYLSLTKPQRVLIEQLVECFTSKNEEVKS